MSALDALRELVDAVRPVEEMMREAAGPRAGYDCSGCGDGYQLTTAEAAHGCPSCEDNELLVIGSLTLREPAAPAEPEDVSAWVLRECADDTWAVLAHHLARAEVAIADADLDAHRPSRRALHEHLAEVEDQIVVLDKQMFLGQVQP